MAGKARRVKSAKVSGRKVACRSQDLIYQPGQSLGNPYIESFIDKLRDECLNTELFTTGREARDVTEIWRREYNELRPHSSLDYMTPAEFAEPKAISFTPRET